MVPRGSERLPRLHLGLRWTSSGDGEALPLLAVRHRCRSLAVGCVRRVRDGAGSGPPHTGALCGTSRTWQETNSLSVSCRKSFKTLGLCGKRKALKRNSEFQKAECKLPVV